MNVFRGLVLVAVVTVCGCARITELVPSLYNPPQPWERDRLAEDKMMVGGNPAETATDDHIYFSKEAASIGRTIGGGGCGCN